DWPVQAVYRAVGYFGSPLPEIPFDELKGVISNREGRVVDLDGDHLPGVYATGWIKRGPVGLIGHTKSDASETIRHLVEDVTGVGDGGDVATGDLTAGRTATQADPQAVLDFLVDRGVDVVEWDDFVLLDEHEKSLGEPHGRERIKVVPRDEMLDIAKRRA
ncbi:MAG TPA: pyridine nucleotide-disulfide oxidoreductase, partial [Phytomonospora sp.]